MRHRVSAPTIILCYHRIHDGVADPFHLCVSPENFAQHLRLLARKATFATLDDALSPAHRPRVVVTFDDGYADNLSCAAPIASELGVPITVYVTSRMVGCTTGFWWDRLGRLVLHGPNQIVNVQLPLDGRCLTVHFGNSAKAPAVIADLRGHLLPLGVGHIDQFLTSLSEQLGLDSAGPPDARPLTAAELDQLSRHENVTVGAHSTLHAQLRDQSFDAQFNSIVRSKHDLEAALGSEVRHFAYPFGGLDSFDDTSVAAVRRAGFSTATTTIPGSVGRSPDPLRLRRRLVMDWSAPRFQAQMIRWGLL